VAGLVCVLAVLSGCVTAEVKSASAALEAARSAGKATECPGPFAEAEDLVKRAELLCNQCKPSEANALAAEAMGKIQALCPAVAVAAPAPAPAPAPTRTPPPPAAEPAPTISISASPSSVVAGSCATLTWSTTNATSVTIDPEPGSVGPSGSRQVCPSSSTRYTLNASGGGGARSDSTSVNVTAKPKPTETLTVHVNFDTNKSAIRPADKAELDKLEAFVRKHQACRFEVNGYTDSTGPEDFNQGLSERRADAVKGYIISKGGAADRVTAAGHGESNPVGDNATAKGRFENRRAEVEAYCQ
jgi:outer membrane protein OmpA-like peptidoglycan-associated protein